MRDLLNLDHSILNMQLFDLAGTAITVGTLAVFVLIVLLSYLGSLALQRALGRTLSRRLGVDEGTLGALKRLLHYGVLAVGIGVGLQTIGINLGAIFAAGAVFAIGIGLALQDLAQNFVSGLILLLERAIKPGDILHVDGRVVKVVSMGIRATIVRTLDDEEMIVPNATIVQSTVTNYTLRDSYYRLRGVVGVVYGSDMKQVQEILVRVAGTLPWREKSHEPVVLLTEFGDSSVNWEVSVWINDPWTMRRGMSELNQAIWWGLKEGGVTIAFPQLDLHFDPPVTESLIARNVA
jgi:small-conductance mechanosensitive channel